MARHNDEHPRNRIVSPFHPSVMQKTLRNMEKDIAGEYDQPHAEYIGWVDKRGRIHFFEDYEDETYPRRISALDLIAVTSLITIVVTLGIGLGMWVATS